MGKIWKEVESELKKRNLKLEAAEKWEEIMFNEKFLPKLRKFGDITDMESHVFAKSFKNIGIMLQVSDIFGKVELTPERKHVNWKKFNKKVFENIKKVLKSKDF